MADTPVEQLTEEPDERNSPPVIRYNLDTFSGIAKHYLTKVHIGTMKDIDTGVLGLTFLEAQQILAAALAEHFLVDGEVYGTETRLKSEISTAAQIRGPKKPITVAYERSLGKHRKKIIKDLVYSAVSTTGTHQGEPFKSALEAVLKKKGINDPYKDKGNMQKASIAESVDELYAKIVSGANRYVSTIEAMGIGDSTPKLAYDTLDRLDVFEATERSASVAEFTAVEAAVAPTDSDALEQGPLEGLLHWHRFDAPDTERLKGIIDLAKQCAEMENLGPEELDALSTDVARRAHHPFGLMSSDDHAHMITAIYLYAGEAPNTAMKKAWNALSRSEDVARQIESGQYMPLIASVNDALVEGIRRATNDLSWMRTLEVRPTAVDMLRLLAAIASMHDVDSENPDWPDGLLEEVLRYYHVPTADIPAGVELLKLAFPLTEPPSAEEIWWHPSRDWNTMGCLILQLVATFDYNLSQTDLEKIRKEASRVAPQQRLLELRLNIVRAESGFPQGRRRTYIHNSVSSVNGWLRKFGKQQAKSYLVDFKNRLKSTFIDVRAGAAATMEDPASGHGVSQSVDLPVDEGSSPTDWFVHAISEQTTEFLSRLTHTDTPFSGFSATAGISAANTAETRTLALTLLSYINRARNQKDIAPPPQAKRWLNDAVEEQNELNDLDDQLDPTNTALLASLLEETIRLAQEKEAGK